ncbi:MAG: hypothetical protein RLZZ274_2074 [Cyanobacteriota bacterium]
MGVEERSLVEGVAIETVVEAMRPAASVRGHLTFHLKHEVLHLELLSRLFEQLDAAELVGWIQQEPTGQYARRAGFLYEWLKGRELELKTAIGGAYVDVVNDRKLVAASPGKSTAIRRWRVRDNLPGTAAFCPIVRKTREWSDAVAVDVRLLLHDLEAEFGEEALLRSAVWMTLRESKASFAIEGEADQADRIERFADVLARRTGEGELPVTDPALGELQGEILGGRTTLQQFGVRQSPVFVGEVVIGGEQGDQGNNNACEHFEPALKIQPAAGIEVAAAGSRSCCQDRRRFRSWVDLRHGQASTEQLA